MIEVIHAGSSGEFAAAGKTIRAVRTALVDYLNITDAHVATINEKPVEDDFVLQEGDVLEFFGDGFKGLGDLLTPSQLMERWGITQEQYQHWLEEGLPAETLLNGDVRHFEMAVDEWCRTRHALAVASRSEATSRMAVDLDAGTATLDGMAYPLERVYLLILESLLRRPNSYVTSSDMKSDHPVLGADPRLDRTIRNFKRDCPPLGGLIHSTTRGYRLNLQDGDE